MKTVGLRRLKSHLSEYVERARSGESIAVTNRGHVVAHLSPPAASAPGTDEEGLLELARLGLVRLATARPGKYPQFARLAKDGTALKLLDFVRGER
jgi:prevent-host-death family protein